MTEKEMNEYKSRYMVKQIVKPHERLTVVFNYDIEGERRHSGYTVKFIAVCEDGFIRPVILSYGRFEVVDLAKEDVSGVYNDDELRRMTKSCNHKFYFYD